ncbi:MAG: hypothetical protein ACOX6A_10345 [Atribacter sp.]|jgi:hypothetical protein|uniref:hypothetical protein n=1 Tax=Atribacter sp. TaxID=2847780 RepID=UPI00175B8431|nr:hypothetical protein [Atribacterota bacterium]HHT09347.1 hypothetical protein [Candidatus Atribacteria bacterium]
MPWVVAYKVDLRQELIYHHLRKGKVMDLPELFFHCHASQYFVVLIDLKKGKTTKFYLKRR